MFCKISAYFAIAALLAGCAGAPAFQPLPPQEPPTVTLAGIGGIKPNLFDPQITLELKVHNPNNVDWRMRGLSLEVEIDGFSVGGGSTKQTILIPARSSRTISVDTDSSPGKVFRMFEYLRQNGWANLKYRLKGDVKVDGVSKLLPFDQKGEMNLPDDDDPDVWPGDRPGTQRI